MLRGYALAPVFAGAVLLAGCGGPEPGSKEWCEAVKKKPQSEVSIDEAQSFAEKCMDNS